MSALRGRFFRQFDWLMFGAALSLLALSILVIATTGSPESRPDALRQLAYIGAGIILLFSFASFDYRLLKRYTPLLYVAMIILLVLVHVVGTEILGARRWIDFGFIQVQPSEIAKVILIIILAKYFSTRVGERPTLKEIFISGIYMALPMGLVITQPDLGTALVFLAIWLVLILATRPRPLHFAALVLGGLATLPIVWELLRPYQKDRLLIFLDPSRDPLGAGYNVTQATIAVGSGELTGRGIGHGTQSGLNFLPVQHTDFIFAALAEQLGFIGGMILLALYFTLLFRAIRAVRLARDQFGMYLATGVTVMLLFHILVNIGMNMGVMPVTGIPLPLVSYGGTSVIMTLVAIGLLQSILIRHRGLQY